MKYGKDGSILQDPIPDNGLKYSPEQIAFLEEHAKAAMQSIIASGRTDAKNGAIARASYSMAEAMLQERTKRLEK